MGNAKELEKILPKNAPLSTMRVLTASCVGMSEGDKCQRGRERITPASLCWLVCALSLCLLLLVAIGVPASAVGMYVVSRQAPPKPLIAPQNALGNTLRYWAAVAKGCDAEVFGSAAAADERKEADGDEHGMALR